MKYTCDCEIEYFLNAKKILSNNIQMVKLEDYTAVELKKMIKSFNGIVKFGAYSKLKKSGLINMMKTHPKIKIQEGANAVKISLVAQQETPLIIKEKKEQKPEVAKKITKPPQQKAQQAKVIAPVKKEPQQAKVIAPVEKKEPVFKKNTQQEKDNLLKLEKYINDNKIRFKKGGYAKSLNLTKKMKLYANNEISPKKLQYKFDTFVKHTDYFYINYITYNEDGTPTNPRLDYARTMNFEFEPVVEKKKEPEPEKIYKLISELYDKEMVEYNKTGNSQNIDNKPIIDEIYDNIIINKSITEENKILLKEYLTSLTGLALHEDYWDDVYHRPIIERQIKLISSGLLLKGNDKEIEQRLIKRRKFLTNNYGI